MALDDLPTETPARVRQVLMVCLQREPGQRAHDIADVRLALGGAFETTVGAATSESAAAPRLPVWQRPPGIVTIGVVTAVLAGLVVWGMTRPAAVPASPIRFTIVPSGPAQLALASGSHILTLSPDGTKIIYRSQSGALDGGRPPLNVRPIDQLDVTPLRGTEGGGIPFVSPDGEWVGFYAADELRKVSILGGPPVRLTRTPADVHGASWGADDQIIFGTFTAGLFRAPAGGGVAETLTTLNTEQGETMHFSPSIIPGRSAVLFVIGVGVGPPAATGELAVLDLATMSVTRLGIAGLRPHYTATGHLVYAAEDGSLRAVPFDAGSLTVTGGPVPLVEGIAVRASGAADFSLSDDGGLVYVSGGPWQDARTLVWVDREGREEPIEAPASPYFYPRLSPDGGRLALDARGDEDGIWIWNFAGETLTRLILGDGNHHYPVWTPDGERIAYVDNRIDDILWKAANNTGAPAVLAEAAGSGGPGGPSPYFFTPDGTAFVHRDQEHPETDDDLVMIAVADGAPDSWRLNGQFRERNAELSPDGRWMAYQSDESGIFEIYVRPFPQVDADQVLVSNNGGSYPLWSRDGRELFYLQPGPVSELISVSFDAGGTDRRFVVRGREPVMEWPYFQETEGRNYEVSPDGQRFIAIKASEDVGQLPTITVVLNWFAELTRRVPTE